MRSVYLGLLFLSISWFLAAENNASPANVEQLELVFSQLENVHNKIDESRKRYRQGNTDDALELLLDYYRNRENVRWKFSSRDKERIIDNYRKLFSNQALLDIEHADSLLHGKWYWMSSYWDCGFPPRWKEEKQEAEYNEQLNRFPFLPVLGRAYWLTGDEKYAEGAILILADWIEKVKPPEHRRVHWDYPAWGLLQVGLRGRFWLDGWEFFIDSPYFTGDFLVGFLYSLIQHGDYIREVSPKSEFGIKADHNHHIMEMEGLFYISVMFPEFRSSHEYKNFAIMELERCRNNQVLSDGVHIEATPGYHNACIWMFARPLILAEANNVSFGPSYKDGIRKMFTFLSCITRPNHTISPFGDSTPGKTTETFALGEFLFGKQVSAFKGDFGTELFWLTNGRLKDRSGQETAIPLIKEFSESGFYSMRSGWDEDALYMTMRNGVSRRLPTLGGHQDADQLSFDLCAYGDALIVDPGVYTYTDTDGLWRKHFKSTEAHNTISVDGRSSVYYKGAWWWSNNPNIGASGFERDQNGISISAWHDGFKPAVSKRKITFVENRFWIIDDLVSGLSGNVVSYTYQFNSNSVEIIKEGFLEGARSAVVPGKASVVVVQIKGNARACRHALRIGGWVADSYLVKRPAKVLRLIDEEPADSSRSVCLIIPFPQGETQDYSVQVEGNRVKVIIHGAYSYQGELIIG